MKQHHLTPLLILFLVTNSFSSIEQQPQKSIVTIPISTGDLVDKITILEVKIQRISDLTKKENILFEWNKLTRILEKQIPITPKLLNLKKELLQTNEKLWDIEDAIRIKESRQQFDNEFIELARNVYYANDHRTSLRRSINELTGSRIIDEKQYPKY